MANVAGGYILMNSNSQMSSFIMVNYYLIEGREEGITEYQPGPSPDSTAGPTCAGAVRSTVPFTCDPYRSPPTCIMGPFT